MGCRLPGQDSGRRNGSSQSVGGREQSGHGTNRRRPGPSLLLVARRAPSPYSKRWRKERVHAKLAPMPHEGSRVHESLFWSHCCDRNRAGQFPKLKAATPPCTYILPTTNLARALRSQKNLYKSAHQFMKTREQCLGSEEPAPQDSSSARAPGYTVVASSCLLQRAPVQIGLR